MGRRGRKFGRAVGADVGTDSADSAHAMRQYSGESIMSTGNLFRVIGAN